MSSLSPVLRSLEGGKFMFWCPGCSGAHTVGPGWSYNGDPAKPTFQPSILVTYNGRDAGQDRGDGHLAPPAVCHSYVTDGRIRFLEDCTHPMAGQTVDIPEWHL